MPLLMVNKPLKISVNLYLTFDKRLNMVGNCNRVCDHVCSSVDMLNQIILDFMNSKNDNYSIPARVSASASMELQEEELESILNKKQC
jgi:hypothetical protein